jgi:uncharacterized damage-inducible protein DinB
MADLEKLLGFALWRQFGAAIDMLEGALLACPDSLWQERLWIVPEGSDFPPQFSEFWYVIYHALLWFDLYLTGFPEEEFVPPAPFLQGEADSVSTLPTQPYTREVLHAYLVATRQKCQAKLLGLSEAELNRPVNYPWTRSVPTSYLELLLYNFRHVEEHAAQLSLFLGQHETSPSQWNARAKDHPDHAGA